MTIDTKQAVIAGGGPDDYLEARHTPRRTFGLNDHRRIVLSPPHVWGHIHMQARYKASRQEKFQ